MLSGIYSRYSWSRYLLPILVVSAFATGAANALFINNSTGLTTPTLTIDFSEHVFADNTVITTQFSDLGVTFTPNLYYQNTFASGQVPNSTPPDLTNFIPGPGSGLANPFSIKFSSPITSAAFVLATGPNTTIFTALLNGVLVETGNASTNLNNSVDFYGFTGITFDEINVSVGTDGFAILDTVQIIPEPSTWVLIFVGGLTLARGVMRLRSGPA